MNISKYSTRDIKQLTNTRNKWESRAEVFIYIIILNFIILFLYPIFGNILVAPIFNNLPTVFGVSTVTSIVVFIFSSLKCSNYKELITKIEKRQSSMLTLIPNSESNQCKNIVLEDKLSSEKKEEILSQAPLMQESTDSTQLDSPTSITNYGKVLQITMKRK